MTTAADIKRWTRSLLESDPTLVLVGRELIVRPVRHVVRAIVIDQTSITYRSNVRYYLAPLFFAPPSGFSWGRELTLARNDDPSFQTKLEQECRGVITELLAPTETVADFVRQTTSDYMSSPRSLGPLPLDRYHRYYGVCLAALGRFEEARAVLALMAEEEVAYQAMLARGKALLRKRANSRSGKFNVEHATFQLAVISQLKRLDLLLQKKDREAIGTLLRDWEQLEIRERGLDHLWEPTPFPVELGEGD